MKNFAYHEAGHVVAALHMGLKVDYTTIEDGVSPMKATKTVRLNDYFDEDQLMFGRLVPKGQRKLSREDYRIFYAILIQKLAGYQVVEMTGLCDHPKLSNHFYADRAFTQNTLRLLKKSGLDKTYEQIERITIKVLKNRWKEVDDLARRLMEEKRVYFNV